MIGLVSFRSRWLWTICAFFFFLLTYRLYFQAPTRTPSNNTGAKGETKGGKHHGFEHKPIYTPAMVKPAGSNYTRMLIIARITKEDVDWIEEQLGSEPLLETANKGHEVMPYLTYIITHYYNLFNVTLFVHTHAVTWHNNDLLDSSAAQIVRALSPPKVVRDGYFNLRCHQEPGCPHHIYPFKEDDDAVNKPEIEVLKVVSQSCCAQLALSRERIRALPLERYEFFRDWLLKTSLGDKLSGGVWEYFCPKEHTCYCDEYGICFGVEEQYTQFFDKRQTVRDLQKKMEEILGVEDWAESTFDEDKDDKLRTIKKKIREIEESD
ncbi:uncharacterized protein K441DRAFT_690543 [Cenococcum geophilum 1.58]|uniref:uncharacterized protein n=1 Tax=Cenococcum geophilum 1.58 TaxID=794803 RepID=UPI00358E1680|nr:hypothetical protein K441DRAFT_690543 [Cenococcum geophilum 1.58]